MASTTEPESVSRIVTGRPPIIALIVAHRFEQSNSALMLGLLEQFCASMDNPDNEFESNRPLLRTARGIVVTKAALSEFTGLAPVTIDKAIAAGAPIIAKGTRKTGWQINSAEFFGWYVRTKVADATGDSEAMTFDLVKTRDKAAQARLRELQIAKMEGELVPVLEVEKWLANKFGECKSRLHAMESQIPALTDEQRFALRMALTDALVNLSGYQAEGEAGFDADANADEFENVDG